MLALVDTETAVEQDRALIMNKTTIALSFSLLALQATAQEEAFYLGAGGGGTNFESKELTVDLAGAPSTTATFDDSDGNVRLFAGYRWRPNFAFEAVVSDLGEFEFIDGADRFDASYEVSSMDLAAVGLLPLLDGRIDLFARTGIAFWSADTRVEAQNLVAASTPSFANRPGTSGQDLFWSVGFNINAFDDNRWTFRSELTTYEISDFEKLETLGFSLQYRF